MIANPWVEPAIEYIGRGYDHQASERGILHERMMTPLTSKVPQPFRFHTRSVTTTPPQQSNKLQESPNRDNRDDHIAQRVFHHDQIFVETLAPRRSDVILHQDIQERGA